MCPHLFPLSSFSFLLSFAVLVSDINLNLYIQNKFYIYRLWIKAPLACGSGGVSNIEPTAMASPCGLLGGSEVAATSQPPASSGRDTGKKMKKKNSIFNILIWSDMKYMWKTFDLTGSQLVKTLFWWWGDHFISSAHIHYTYTIHIYNSVLLRSKRKVVLNWLLQSTLQVLAFTCVSS